MLYSFSKSANFTFLAKLTRCWPTCQSSDGEDLLWSSLSFGCSEPLSAQSSPAETVWSFAKICLRLSFCPTLFAFSLSLCLYSLSLFVSVLLSCSHALSLWSDWSAEMLVCREWLKQWKEERKKGGCRVMSATVSPQAFWCRRVHPTHTQTPLKPLTSPSPTSCNSGARCRRGTCNQTQWKLLVGDTRDDVVISTNDWVLNAPGEVWFWFLDLISYH